MLCDLEEWSYEAAAALGCPVGTGLTTSASRAPRSSVCPPTLALKMPPLPRSCCGSESTKIGKNSFFPRAAQAILSWSRTPFHFLLRAHLS